jgi:putative ABC transport system permease protein
MDTLLQDLRYALRTLGRSRGFVAVAVICLALGIGVNTAVFSMVNTFLLKPLPIRDEGTVLRIFAVQPRQGIDDAGMSMADVDEIRRTATTLSAVAPMYGTGLNLAGGDGEPVRLEAFAVAAGAFPLIGVSPALGRGFTVQDEVVGGPRVVLLSDELWRHQFNSDPAIVGKDVVVNGAPSRVIGVMPPRFKFPETADLWIPLRWDPAEENRDDRYVMPVVRLKPGVTLDQAKQELQAISARLARQYPETNAGWSFGANRWRDDYVEDIGTQMTLMMASVGFVLLIACANVANLLLARATARRREIAVRAALGATRGRLVRQLLTESVLVALMAGVLGIMVGVAWMRYLVSRIPEEMAYWITFAVDFRVLGYTLLLSLATGLIFGTLPAMRGSRLALQDELKEGTRGSSDGPGRGRLRGVLVGGEVALSAVLLVMAALMMRSFMAATAADVGFDTRPLLAMRTSLTGDRYNAVATRAGFFLQASERMAQIPGVQSAAFATALPGDDGGNGVDVQAEGRPRAAGDELAARTIGITPGFFATLNRPLIAGRAFTAAEAADTMARVAIINPELARALWPGEDPLGRRVGFHNHWYTVVGVAPTLQYEEIGEETASSRRQIHVPYAQEGWRLMTLIVRTRNSPAAAAPAVRAAIRGMDRTLPVFDVRTMEEYRRYTTWDRRIFGEVFASFGLLALILAAVGVYGVTSYSVSQRQREIGIRMALGARPVDVLRQVGMQGSVSVLVGIVIGLALSWGASRAMASILYGIGPSDPLSFITVPLVLLSAAVLATVIPARRATLVDPNVALRSE